MQHSSRRGRVVWAALAVVSLAVWGGGCDHLEDEDRYVDHASYDSGWEDGEDAAWERGHFDGWSDGHAVGNDEGGLHVDYDDTPPLCCTDEEILAAYHDENERHHSSRDYEYGFEDAYWAVYPIAFEAGFREGYRIGYDEGLAGRLGG